MATLQIEHTYPGWKLWLLWIGATIGGLIAYVIVSALVFAALASGGAIQQSPTGEAAPWWVGIAAAAIGEGALGAAIGLGQWLVLRRELKRVGWWVLATLGGYLFPGALRWVMPDFESPWLGGATTFVVWGIALGTLQWLVLRGRVQHAEWWIVVSLAGWVLAFGLIGAAILAGVYVDPFDLLAAFLVPVAVGGGGITWLLRKTAPAV